ncbi:MAG: restriction endonuclease [Bacteroidia bacterium]|nr:restriction endonuclease [Bacteroidia bacterium]
MRKFTITKQSGVQDVYDVSKLSRSLNKSGAPKAVISQIIEEIEHILYDGISTNEIYKKAFSILRKNSRPNAARYKLKKAIMELGPTGYPFEMFIAEILVYQGFITKVGVLVKGHCANHEVDVVAEKNDKHFMVECKFHMKSGRHCDVKIPLYIQSRFKDVEKQWLKQDGHQTKFHQGWIVTNTRFTSDAIQYGNCANLMMIGWNYPDKRGLKDLIDISGLHPITCLTTLTKHEKQKLLSMKKVLSRNLCEEPNLLKQIGVDKGRLTSIYMEAEELCNQND